jgi:surfactin synthase thioesterase subunit
MITLVAVHGNGGGGFRFARVEPHVPDHIRFEAVTLPGFGGRPGDPSLRTLPDYAERLWREIEHLPRPSWCSATASADRSRSTWCSATRSTL